jgi:hypothetical protein
MIEGTGDFKATILKALNDSVTFTLKSNKSIVNLKFVNIAFYGVNAVQIFAKLNSPLSFSEKYAIHMSGHLTNDEREFNEVFEEYNLLIAGKKNTPLDLQWKNAPEITFIGRHNRYSVGNGLTLKNDLFNKNVLFKVKINSIRDPMKSFLYHISGDKGILQIGGKICEDYFYFKDWDEYDIELTPIDAAGNEGVMKKIRVKV